MFGEQSPTMEITMQNHIGMLTELAAFLNAWFMKATLLNQQWNGALNYDETITQELIDSVPQFKAAGITVHDLAEMNYINFQMLALMDASKQPVIAKMSNV
jgi:hypothetical protein